MDRADLDELRQIADKAKAGLELTDEERERARVALAAASAAMAPMVEQMRRAFEDMAKALGPLLQQVARSFANIRQDEYALAPPRPGGKARGPGRRGREAQRSPYGPQGRR